MKILITFENKIPEMKSADNRNKIVDWVGDLYDLGKFRESTSYIAGLGAAEGNKTLKEEGKLRIDRQRVIGVNEETVVTNQYRIGNIKKKNVQTFDSLEEAEKALGKSKAKITTLEKATTTAEHVWTLFAAQIDKTHNQVFVYNNCNFLGSLGKDNWIKLWQYTLDNACTAIISKDTGTVPSGISQAWDGSATYVD